MGMALASLEKENIRRGKMSGFVEKFKYFIGIDDLDFDEDEIRYTSLLMAKLIRYAMSVYPL